MSSRRHQNIKDKHPLRNLLMFETENPNCFSFWSESLAKNFFLVYVISENEKRQSKSQGAFEVSHLHNPHQVLLIICWMLWKRVTSLDEVVWRKSFLMDENLKKVLRQKMRSFHHAHKHFAYWLFWKTEALQTNKQEKTQQLELKYVAFTSKKHQRHQQGFVL